MPPYATDAVNTLQLSTPAHAAQITVVLGTTRVGTDKVCWRRVGFVIHGFRKGEVMNRAHFWLTEEQFRRIEPCLPTDTRSENGSMTGV